MISVATYLFPLIMTIPPNPSPMNGRGENVGVLHPESGRGCPWGRERVGVSHKNNVMNYGRLNIAFAYLNGQFAVPHQHLLLRVEMLCQVLGEIHRPVLPTGTTDGDRQIAAVVGHETGQPARDEVTDVGVH